MPPFSCLYHDDRVDSLGGLIAAFADVLGVDPALQAKRNSADRDDEEWEKLFGADDGDDEYGIGRFGSSDKRAAGLNVSKR